MVTVAVDPVKSRSPNVIVLVSKKVPLSAVTYTLSALDAVKPDKTQVIGPVAEVKSTLFVPVHVIDETLKSRVEDVPVQTILPVPKLNVIPAAADEAIILGVVST